MLKYCGGCPVPFVCQCMVPCGNCYTDCDDEGYWTPDKDHVDGKCGYGFVREGAEAHAARNAGGECPFISSLRHLQQLRQPCRGPCLFSPEARCVCAAKRSAHSVVVQSPGVWTTLHATPTCSVFPCDLVLSVQCCCNAGAPAAEMVR